MRRTTKVSRKKKPKQAVAQSQTHWRSLALSRFPEHEEFISSDDEEYGIYNLFFQLRGQFADAISEGNSERAARILDFAGRCLQSQLTSDGEDISAAAGVSLFEHIFEDTPQKRWSAIFSCMPRMIYYRCRHYLEQWMEPEVFSKLDAEATKYYG